jgi:hypothetical protein
MGDPQDSAVSTIEQALVTHGTPLEGVVVFKLVRRHNQASRKGVARKHVSDFVQVVQRPGYASSIRAKDPALRVPVGFDAMEKGWLLLR